MSCSITQPSAVHVLVTAAATDQGQFQTILKFRAHMPLDWLGEETVGGLWVAEMDALDFPMPQHTHTHVYTLVHTHLACVLCLYELQNMHKSCAENLYLHFVLPVLFNNIWSANGWGEGEVARGKWERGKGTLRQLKFWGFSTACCLCWRRRCRHCLCGFESFAFSHFAFVSVQQGKLKRG